MENMITQNKRVLIIITSVTVLLLIPLIAMQFSDEVKWSVFDFVVAGVLLLSAAFSIEFVLRKINKKETRIVLLIIILLALIMVWLELAVGIFGTPLAGS